MNCLYTYEVVFLNTILNILIHFDINERLNKLAYVVVASKCNCEQNFLYQNLFKISPTY